MPVITRNARHNSQAEDPIVGQPNEAQVEAGTIQPPAVRGARRQGARRGRAGAVQEPQPTTATGGRRGGSRGGARGGLVGTRSGQPRSETPTSRPRVDPANDSFFDDPGHGEKLQARNGCLGTIGSRGFEAKTNFLIDVYALINSSNVYKLKGTLIICSNFPR